MRWCGAHGFQSQRSHAILETTLWTNRAVRHAHQGRHLSVVPSARAHRALRVSPPKPPFVQELQGGCFLGAHVPAQRGPPSLHDRLLPARQRATKGSPAASAATSLVTSIKNCPPNRPAWLVRHTRSDSLAFSAQRPKARASARKVTFLWNELCKFRWITTSCRAGYFNRDGRSGEVCCASTRWLPQRAACICASNASSASVPTPQIYLLDIGRSIMDVSFCRLARSVLRAPLATL
jgi:hypothetical protein